MPGDVIPFEMPANALAEMKELFGDPASNNDLSEGVAQSFGVISFKGKVWRVKYKGEEKIVRHPESGDPMPSLVAVIVKGSPQISKIYYPGAYTEGSDDAPDCYSIDGVRPDPSSPSVQSPTCASCPRNVWGSKVTEQGNKTKACADSRRLAVVPYPDLKNENFGGPLLLRVPPASLQELDSYNKDLQRMGLPYQAVVTKISFDHELAYPKLKFQAVKGLDKEQAMTVLELANGDVTARMLAEAPITDEAVTPAQAAAVATEKGPGAAADPEPVAEPVAEPPVAEAKPTAPAVEMASPEPEPKPEPKPTAKEANSAEVQNVSQELDGLLGTLL